jgi:hypothetical protein
MPDATLSPELAHGVEQLAWSLLAAARRAALYSPDHPLVRRGIESVLRLSAERLQRADSIVIGFVGDDVVVDGVRPTRSPGTQAGFVRELREKEIEKITIARGVRSWRGRTPREWVWWRTSTRPIPSARRSRSCWTRRARNWSPCW